MDSKELEFLVFRERERERERGTVNPVFEDFS
jgi:hypothetical protein